MNSQPKISIIMNCHNGEKYIKKSVKSILNQTYNNWELIFFDNLSIDKTQHILNEFKDKRIRYIKSKKFLKLYEARNQAILKARGKYICFCDIDDWWIKGKLLKQVSYLKKNKKANFIFSNFWIYNEKKKKTYLYFKKMSNGKITQALLDDYKIGILTVFMNKRFFKTKKFNKKYNIIGDYDFFLNLSLKENFYCIQEPLAFYRYHDNNLSQKINLYVKEMDYWINRNIKKFEKLNYSLKKFKFNYYKLKLKQLINQILNFINNRDH